MIVVKSDNKSRQNIGLFSKPVTTNPIVAAEFEFQAERCFGRLVPCFLEQTSRKLETAAHQLPYPKNGQLGFREPKQETLL